MDDVQNKPLESAVQSLVPQAQLSELTEVPSIMEHDVYRLQAFVEEVQKKPESGQILVPHMHVDGFTKAPALFGQPGPVQQPHLHSVEHVPVFNAEPK